MTVFENTPFDALEPGMEAETRRVCLADDLYVFANSSGNLNPMHLPREDGDGDGLPEAVAPSMWVAALISAVLGNQLPGPGSLYRAQSLRWHGRAHAGDELVVRVRVLELLADRGVRMATEVRLADGTLVCDGEAEVIAPAGRQSFRADDIPGLTVQRHVHFDALLDRAEPLDAIPTAVVAPEDAASLGGALLARDHTLIAPILVGEETRIRAAAAALGADLSGLEIDHAGAARRAVALVHDGRAKALMKGNLHTDVLLEAVLKREGGLRTTRRLSHVFVMDVPGLPHLLMITDAAINIAPDLETKVDITQNAIDLARALGVEEPKVGVLSAVETVNPKIPSTLDAAALSKMAERGQISGGIVDGPLAMDNAIDLQAARTKGIRSAVAGRADILVVPNLESGNMLAKELTFVAHAEAGGIVIGAQVPIVLTSRADDDKARLASCAVAALYAARRQPPV
jgi:phosphate butyryltransferase